MTFKLKPFLIILALGMSLSTGSLKAQESSGGIWSVIGEYISRIASNLDYVELSSDDLGIDNGLIAQVILGTGRIVERNPESTGDHDRYLVKDKMRIGLRLGAGFVVAGSASYIRQYTLVYPVSKKLEGIFHDKFIVNLLLPLDVAFDKLPPKYVLMTESFIEGQGRIKLGGTPLIPIGSTTSLGRVQLGRSFIDFKTDKKVKVFRDKARFTRLAQDINFSLGLIGIPIYEGRYDRGWLKRKYLEIDITKPSQKARCQKALKKLLLTDDVTELIPLGKLHSVNTKFVEHYNYFTLAWLFTIEGIDRTDRITEYHADRDEYVTRYQVENRRYTSWTLGIDGEMHLSKLWAMARGTDENGYIDPEIRIALIVKDGWLKESELVNTYQKMVDKITYQNEFMKTDSSFLTHPSLTGEFQMHMDIHLYKEAFEKLLNTSGKKYWAMLDKIQKKKRNYYKDASKRNYHAREQRRLKQNRVPLKDLYLAKSMKAFIRRIEIAKKQKDPLSKMHWLVLALRKLTYVSSETFQPTVFQLIHALVGTKNLYISNEWVNLVSDQAIKIGVQHPTIKRTMGSKRESQNRFHPFYFQDASEIYYLF